MTTYCQQAIAELACLYADILLRTPTCALATHIALEEAGADYKPSALISARTSSAAEFLKLNPKGRVPLLVTTGRAH